MIRPSPLDTDTAVYRIQGDRHARQIALRAVHLNQLEIAHQLRELDDAIVWNLCERAAHVAGTGRPSVRALIELGPKTRNCRTLAGAFLGGAQNPGTTQELHHQAEHQRKHIEAIALVLSDLELIADHGDIGHLQPGEDENAVAWQALLPPQARQQEPASKSQAQEVSSCGKVTDLSRLQGELWIARIVGLARNVASEESSPRFNGLTILAQVRIVTGGGARHHPRLFDRL